MNKKSRIHAKPDELQALNTGDTNASLDEVNSTLKGIHATLKNPVSMHTGLQAMNDKQAKTIQKLEEVKSATLATNLTLDRNSKNVQKMELMGAEIITIKGKDSDPREVAQILVDTPGFIESLKPEDGRTPTYEELIDIIMPLIPEPIPGTPGRDGRNIDENRVIRSVIEKIPAPENGKDGRDGSDGSPDTGVEIVSKINRLPVTKESPKIDWKHIKNAPEPQVINNYSGGGSATRIKSAGTIVKEATNELNFIGATVTSTPTGADISFNGGGAVDSVNGQTGVVVLGLTDFGVTATSAELNFLTGATSNIQGQIDGLIAGGVSDGDKGDVTVSSSGTVWTIDNGAVTSAKTSAGVQASLALADSAVQDLSDLGITASALELNVLDGITSSTAELNILDGVTSTAAELNILDGATLTTTELNYVDGVTSSIQTQLNAKGTFTLPSLTAGSVLFSNGTTIVQDNANFFWDNSNKRLGIGTNAPTSAITVYHSTASGPLPITIRNTIDPTTPSAQSGMDFGFSDTRRVTFAVGPDSGFGAPFDQSAYFFSQGNVAGLKFITYDETPIAFWTNFSERMRITGDGNFGVGASTVSAKVHVISTSEQLRVGYDASNYYSTTVGSTGGVTFDAVGSGALFTFSDDVRITTAGTNSASAVTVGGTQALTNKNLTSGTNTFPTFNQNTTGSAATLTTTRTIWGQNFNGSANVTGTLALGASDLTMTGSLAATGSRVTKGWFTDIESTNMITIGGTSLSSVAATFTNKRMQPRTASSTSNANLSPDVSSASVYFRTTQTVGLTIDAPTGTPVIGETIALYVDSAGAQTLTINSTYKVFGAAFPASTTAGKTFMMTAQYNGTDWKTTWANAI